MYSNINFADPDLNVGALMDFQDIRSILYTTNLYLMWLQFFAHLQAFRMMAMFVMIGVLMLSKLVEFMVVLVISVVAFASADHIYFACKKHQSRTFWQSISYRWYTLFDLVKLPVAQDENGGSLDRGMIVVMDSLFALLTVTLLLNFLIAVRFRRNVPR